MTSDFLAPGRLWLLLAIPLLAIAYVVVLRWRRVAQVRFTQVELLDEVAPHRPGWRRHLVAILQLTGLAVGLVAIARPVDRTTERERSQGRIFVLFDVSLSMMATDVDPDRFTAAQEAARDFVDEVDPDVEVGLISFSGVVNVEVAPTLDRDEMERGIDDLELAESTAIGEALATATELLVRGVDEPDEGANESTDPDEEQAPGVIVLLSDGETTVGRETAVGADEAVDAGVPVFTIAFGTEDGSISDPVTGEVVPVPVRPADLADVAERTGGAAFEAETGRELADAYDQIRESLGETLGEATETITELTWRWALASVAVLATAWLLALWWLRGMV
ncbi:MAG TPA: VWA domain-containing protein [Ilumatobacteraceae bacterium]|nr:VWA domain-containing protein [Ilumatobacteraceae bacterium]